MTAFPSWTSDPLSNSTVNAFGRAVHVAITFARLMLRSMVGREHVQQFGLTLDHHVTRCGCGCPYQDVIGCRTPLDPPTDCLGSGSRLYRILEPRKQPTPTNR